VRQKTDTVVPAQGFRGLVGRSVLGIEEAQQPGRLMTTVHFPWRRHDRTAVGGQDDAELLQIAQCRGIKQDATGGPVYATSSVR